MDHQKKAQLNILIAGAGDLPEQVYPVQAASELSSASMRPESVIARRLTAKALHIFLGRAPSPGELDAEVRSPGGKPYFPAFPDFHYNISHSGSYVVCAICDHPVGVDLQQIPDQAERAVKIAKRFFSAQEQEALRVLQDRNDTEALCRLFCRYWTARESYIKLTGRGLAEPFENFRPDLEAGVILVLKRDSNDTSAAGSKAGTVSTAVTSDTECTAEAFCLSEYPAPAGYCLTVCSTVPLLDEPA